MTDPETSMPTHYRNKVRAAIETQRVRKRDRVFIPVEKSREIWDEAMADDDGITTAQMYALHATLLHYSYDMNARSALNRSRPDIAAITASGTRHSLAETSIR